MTGETDLSILLASMSPELDDRDVVFAIVSPAELPRISEWIGLFHEAEGLTVICSREQAEALCLERSEPFRKISLKVHSSLNAIGLTARVAEELTAAAIPCNVVAGYYHDHLFVPAPLAEAAMRALTEFSKAHQ